MPFATAAVLYMSSSHAVLALQLKSPKMVCMNLTLAADGGAQEADPKPQTVMFNVGAVEKSERFCTIVEQSIPK